MVGNDVSSRAQHPWLHARGLHNLARVRRRKVSATSREAPNREEHQCVYRRVGGVRPFHRGATAGGRRRVNWGGDGFSTVGHRPLSADDDDPRAHRALFRVSAVRLFLDDSAGRDAWSVQDGGLVRAY